MAWQEEDNNQEKTGIIYNLDNIDMTSNELFIRDTLNRNFKKLFENDMRLLANSLDVYSGVYRVLPYDEEKTYQKNDLVWFVDVYIPPGKKELYDHDIAVENSKPIPDNDKLKEIFNKYSTTTLYLLKSTRNNNTFKPKRTLINMEPRFDASFWKNENPFGSIFTDYLDEFVLYKMRDSILELHDKNKKYHKFGSLSAYSELDKKVLKTDLKNIDPDRDHIFFPNETEMVQSTDVIIDGWMRKWDCGLLEYNIIYKLGDTQADYATYNETTGNIKLMQGVGANTFNLKNIITNTDPVTTFDNRRYYLNDDDADIFAPVYPAENTQMLNMNGITQINVNDFINTYTGTIKFPVPFIDTNYCIFNTMQPCVMINKIGTDVEPNVNNIVFANKARNAVTAVLIVPTYAGGEPKVLYNNKFMCQIVGRWRVQEKN